MVVNIWNKLFKPICIVYLSPFSMKNIGIVVVERSGSLKNHMIKDFKVEELYKKCGFKKAEDFVLQTEWKVSVEGTTYNVQLYGKTDGRANTENKYEFPPPVDNTLYFGTCALLAQAFDTRMYVSLTVSLWTKMYEKLYGGFEDLVTTAKEDEEEEDELANVPASMKTKEGYLKDGFVVDSNDGTDDGSKHSSETEYETEDDSEDDELSEESYDYSSDVYTNHRK